MFEQSSTQSTGEKIESKSTTRDASTYTIPEKYLPPAHHLPARSSKRMFIIGGIVLVVVLAVVAVVVYALQFVVTPEPTPVAGNFAAINNVSGENANTNAHNSNTNNANAVTNDNANTQNNINAPVNDNANVNTNTNIPENTNVAVNTNTAVSPLQVVANAADKDRDDLTDTEEELYGTKISLPDTDKDGFVDGTEVKNLYSPLAADETLKKSGIVTEYKNKNFHWSVLYPTPWLADAVDPEEREVLFTPETGEGEWMEVLITDNPNKQTAAEWYTSLSPDRLPGTFSEVEIAGLRGIVANNGLTYYFVYGETILGFIYNVGTATEAHFQTTFAMMLKSLTITNSTTP